MFSIDSIEQENAVLSEKQIYYAQFFTSKQQ